MADLHLLRSFLAVYRAKSISRAAPVVGISQPALSQQVKALEVLLGRPLFVRRAKGVVPTSAADELARSISQQVDALELTVEALRSGTSSLAGSLFIGGPAEFLSVRALPALAPLVEKGVKLHVTLGLPAQVLEAVVADELDLAIVTRKVGARSLQYTPLYEEAFALVASAQVASRISSRALSEGRVEVLEGVPLLTYSADLPLVRRFFREVFGVPAKLTAAVTVPDLRAVVELTRAKAGMAVLPVYLCKDLLDSGELVELVRTPRQARNVLHLALRSDRAQTPRVRAAADLLLRAASTW